MLKKSDREELERRLEQAHRMAKQPVDPLTKERLEKLISDLEEQLQ
jgi:DNA-binding protein YbaB